ncbi:hypothetical protein RD792_011465 [Penstemon davidsonii]|uniref:MADS-box domain-containing protein n=1 Tax=Penstemon davidsonii TaxID=160366 RepID=A0ABR0D620_9LAMI|nr:hypothetical protein RD792_011465 [Penstemon davidsonii]
MAREKVTLAYITDESQRRASFNERKKELIKEVSEISSLYGVEACVIIRDVNEPEQEVWPSHVTAHTLLERFHMSQLDQSKKAVDEECFIAKEKKKQELKDFMYKCMYGMASLSDFDMRDKADMELVMKEIEQEINSRLKEFNGN